MLDVRTVTSVNHLYVAVLVLRDDASGCLVEAFLYQLDACVEINLEWVGSAW